MTVAFTVALQSVDSAVILPATAMFGGHSRSACCLDVNGGRSLPTCCLAEMRGGCRNTCHREDNWRRQAPYLPQAITRSRSRHTCGIVLWTTQSPYLLPRRGCEAAVDIHAASKTTGGGYCPTCRRRSSEAAVDIPAASTTTGGGYCPTCRRRSSEAAVDIPASSKTTGGCSRLLCCLAVNARRRMPYLPTRRQLEAALVLHAADDHWRPQSTYLLPRRGCEAADALPCLRDDNWRWLSFYLPQTIIGGRNRPTCCLAVDARRLSTYMPPQRQLEAAVDLLAAPPWMRGGGRLTCSVAAIKPLSPYLLPRRICEAVYALPCLREDNWRRQASNLPPRRGCEAADALPCLRKHNWRRQASYLLQTISGGLSRPTCRIAVDARRRMPYLPHRRQLEAAVVLLATDDNWRRQTSYLPPRRGCEAADALPAADNNWRRLSSYLPQSIYLLPRLGCKVAVDLHASIKKTGGCSRCTCCLAVDARRRMPYLPQTTTGGGRRPICLDDH